MLMVVGLMVIPPAILGLIGWRIMWKQREIERLQREMLTYAERHSMIDRMERIEEVHFTEGKKQVLPPPEIRVTNAITGDNPIVDTKHKKAEILIPQNLSEEEKQVLRDFYNL